MDSMVPFLSNKEIISYHRNVLPIWINHYLLQIWSKLYLPQRWGSWWSEKASLLYWLALCLEIFNVHSIASTARKKPNRTQLYTQWMVLFPSLSSTVFDQSLQQRLISAWLASITSTWASFMSRSGSNLQFLGKQKLLPFHEFIFHV